MDNRPLTLLLVDQSAENRETCRRVLDRHPRACRLLEAEDGETALALLARERPDCVLLDFGLPDMDGLDLLRAMNQRLKNLPVIVVTGQGRESVAAAVAALKAGARDYLIKDPEGAWLELLPAAIERAVGVQARELQELRERESHLRRINRTYAVLSRGNHALVHSQTEQDLLDGFCHALVETGGFSLVWVARRDPSAPGRLRAVAWAGQHAGFEARHCVTLAEDAAGAGPIARAVRDGGTVVARLPDDRRCADACPLACGGNRHRTVVGLPLQEAGSCFGALAIYSGEPDPFDAEELRLLEELARDLSYGVQALRTRQARDRAERELRLRDRAIAAARDGVMIVDVGQPEHPLIYVNRAFEEITGYPAAEVLGRNPAFLHGDDPDQPDLGRVRAAVRAGRPAVAVLRNVRKDGSRFWNELHVAPVHDDDGRFTHFVGIVNDVSERIHYQDALEHQATHDALTGLPNRVLLEDRLGHALALSSRIGSRLAVLFLDLDHFKLINDVLGHRVGDLLLKAVAERLCACAREGDTVARYGGDEFVMLLPDLARPDDLQRVTRRILAAVARPLALEGDELKVTASIGVALYPRDGADPGSLLSNADTAMYRAKELGRNRVEEFAAALGDRVSERLGLEQELRRALDRDELTLHYQPQVDLADGRLIGLEALARWTHPARGPIAPARFIPVAEEAGLILPLGEWVLRSACAQAVAWARQGLAPLALAVNVSARQLERPGFVTLLARVLDETGVEPGRLELELTESVLLGRPDLMLKRLEAVKRLGVRLALDDFGTGYSSLAYLKRFPFDRLKIDRSFVKDLPDDPNDAAIAVTIVAMARSLGMEAVAEGVETEAQRRFLVSEGCSLGQGWLFGRPLPVDATEALLRETG